MNFKDLTDNLLKSGKDDDCKHLLNFEIPDISLPNQNGNLLNLHRSDSFRIVIYCFPMTGRPDRPLPKNWNKTPGAQGCTIQNCSFRDSYDQIIINNALPIGISTQSIDDLKEMTQRLNIPYDVLSDQQLKFCSALTLPNFSIEDKKFIKRLTLIIEKSVIKHVFYPIFSPENHIKEVLNWLEQN